MKRILVLAYSVSPIRGSEYSVAWNYINEMSENNRLIVLYGMAGDHMGDFHEIEGKNFNPSLINVTFISVFPGKLANLINQLNKKKIFIFAFYVAYRIWHLKAYKMAIEILESQDVDIIHYLCPIGYREPGFLWKIKKPYIWGPIGGMKNRPLGLAFSKNFLFGIKTLLRNIINYIQFRYNSRLKMALNNTDLLLSSTTENKNLIFNIHSHQSIYLPENAIIDKLIQNDSHKKINKLSVKHIQLIWIGSIDDRKSLDILLHSLGKISNMDWRLNIVGSGPLLSKMKILANYLSLNEKIDWVGHISREKIYKLLSESDLNIITSISEGNPTTIWEAMAFGVPTLSLNHCGMHDSICNQCGILIDISDINTIIFSIKNELEKIINNPTILEHLKSGVFKCSSKYLWSKRRRDWEYYYDLAIYNYSNSNKGFV